MRYKLIRSFPGSPPVGSILNYLSKDENIYDGNGAMYYDIYYDRWEVNEVESNPEYFAPWLFQTKDGVDIYTNDVFYYIGDAGNICCTACIHVGEGKEMAKFKTFSTKEAAQKWIDSQRKPIWKTEDGYDVFGREPVKWVIFNKDSKTWSYKYDLPMAVPGCATDNPELYRVFKDKDKMNKWIDEQNKPKFEVDKITIIITIYAV